MRVALLIRAVPLLQLIATGTLGSGVYQRPGLAAAACCCAAGWSGYAAIRIWPGGRAGWRLCCCDGAVSVAVLAVAGACVPAQLVTTSFFWPATFAASSVLLIGLSMPSAPGAAWLILVAAAYGTVVVGSAGVRALPVAAGNAAGMAAYFVLGAVIARYAWRLAGWLARAGQAARQRETQLGVRRARLKEFGRLHDEAVQVLEQVAAASGPPSAGLRAHAARAAAGLRAGSREREPDDGTLLQALAGVADGFTALGFPVAVEQAGASGAAIGHRSRALLTAAVVEALNNACKHSGANGAAVRVAAVAGGAEVTVEDHGRGFDQSAVRIGFGLAASIRQRLEDAGGTVGIQSAPGAGTAIRMWLPSAAGTGGPSLLAAERIGRARVLLVLAGRAACCAYAAAVTAVNLAGYRSPALAVAVLSLALLASAGLGLACWRRQAVPGGLALLDAGLAAVVLAALAGAISPSDRVGSLNWALAYAVSSASWLALGCGWRSGAAPAGALGVVYWIAVAGGRPGAALTATALVNAAGPPLYFGICVAGLRVMRRAGAEIDARQDIERGQCREMAALRECERLVREVHQPVLAILDLVTAGRVSGAELRARACAEVTALRRAFSGSGSSRPGDLRALLIHLARERAGLGWIIQFVDDEVEAELSPASAAALTGAFAELVDGPAPDGDLGLIRVRVRATADQAELVVRLPACASVLAGPLERASSWLAAVAGTAELDRALAGESRVLLRAPA